jgi:hypothetical protein
MGFINKNNVTLLPRQDIDLCGGEWIVESGAAEGCIIWPTDQKSVALSRCGAVFPAFGLPFLLPLALSQAGIDSTLARIRIVLGCPHLCRLVAPARRLLAASLFVCPWHPEEPPQALRTRSDDPRHAVTAAGAPDPGSLERRRRRLGHVLWLYTRLTQPGAAPGVLAPLQGLSPCQRRQACLGAITQGIETELSAVPAISSHALEVLPC